MAQFRIDKRCPGEKGWPTAADFKASQTKESVEEASNPTLHRARLIKRVLKAVKTPHETDRKSTRLNSSH